MESGQFHDCVRIITCRSCFCSVYVPTVYIIEAWAIVYYLCQAVQSFIAVIFNSFMLFLFCVKLIPLKCFIGAMKQLNIMIEQIKFYIPQDKFTYTLEFETDGQFVFLDQSLRYPDFSNPVGALTQLISKQEFNQDLNFFLDRLISSNKEVDTEYIQQIFVDMCLDHIVRLGRLFYFDLLTYADLYINIDRAIYHRNKIQYQLLYRDSVYLILNKYPTRILIQKSLLGNRIITWAEKLEEDEEDEEFIRIYFNEE